MRAARDFIGRLLFGQTSPQDDFRTDLQAWVESANPEERESRVEAMQRMIRARRNRSTELRLVSLELSSLPLQIGELTALRSLDLSFNRLTALPDSMGNLTALTSLNLHRNQLTIVPESIVGLTALNYLHLSRNQLRTLPERIGDLTALTYLNLSHNRLYSLPGRIGDLTALHYLDLSYNRLYSLPGRIGDLTALSVLNLQHNDLTFLPDSIINLPAVLRIINLPAELRNSADLGFNQISRVEFARLSALASAGRVTLAISIQDHRALGAAAQQESTNSIKDKILLKAPEEKKEELKALLDSEQLPNFKQFLAECPSTEAWKSHEPEMTQCLFEVANKMSESEVLRIKYETLAETALGTCGDRVGLAFVQMQLALNSSDKEVKDMTPQEVYDYAKQESVIKFLSDKAETRIKEIKTRGGHLDPIETRLAYLQIGSDLGLNLRASGMLYQACSNVTKDDLESAKAEFQALDLHLQTAKHLYEDGMLRKHPFVQGVITEVSESDDFSTNQKESENSQEYNTRMVGLVKSAEEAAITKIRAKFDGLRSGAKAGSNSAEGGASQQKPASTTTPADGAPVVGGGSLEQSACSTINL